MHSNDAYHNIPKAPIVLLTDFGLSDPFVGQMKGVIARISPEATVIDLCHYVPPQNVVVGAIFLRGSIGFFPVGTIFVAVVDPGVGTDRNAVIVKTRGQYFVGPDNGLMWNTVLSDEGGEDEWEAVKIENRKYMLPEISDTFHGRDIFAPAAAHLMNGVPMKEFGPKLDKLVATDVPQPFIENDVIRGRVVYIDHFGNAWTNVSLGFLKRIGWLEKSGYIVTRVASCVIKGLQKSYIGAKANKPIALINSFKLVEIAWPGESAEKKLRLWEGVWVDMELMPKVTAEFFA